MKKDEKSLSRDINERGTAAARGTSTFTRQNPATGVTERGEFPQNEQKDRMAEGWKPLKDVTGDSVGEVDNPVVANPVTGVPVAPVAPAVPSAEPAPRK